MDPLYSPAMAARQPELCGRGGACDDVGCDCRVGIALGEPIGGFAEQPGLVPYHGGGAEEYMVDAGHVATKRYADWTAAGISLAVSCAIVVECEVDVGAITRNGDIYDTGEGLYQRVVCTIQPGTRCLLAGQTDISQNGIYVMECVYGTLNDGLGQRTTLVQSLADAHAQGPGTATFIEAGGAAFMLASPGRWVRFTGRTLTTPDNEDSDTGALTTVVIE